MYVIWMNLNKYLYNLFLQRMMIQANKKYRNADKTKDCLLSQDQFYRKVIQQNRQSHQPPLPQPQPSKSPLHLLVHTAIHILRQKSLAHFFSLYTDLIHSFRSTGIQWMQQIQHSKMHSLITLIEIRVSIVGDMFYYIFGGLEDLVQRLKSKLGIKYNLAELIWRVRQNNRKQNSRDRAHRISRQYEANLHRVVKYKQHPMDTQFLEILQLMETSMNRQTDQVAKQQHFKNLTSSDQFQPVKYHWRQIFQKLQAHKRRLHLSNQKQISTNNFKYIQHHKLMNVNCLGCIKFLYKQAVIQPGDAQLYAVFPYIYRLKQYEAEVKQKINLMMSSGGGVILFDCHPEFFNIRVQGAKMSEKQKEAFEQMLISYLPSFYPRLKMNENVFISFVPIVQNSNTKDLSFLYYKGEEALMKQGQRYIERQYLQGHYVCRVIIRPFEDRRVTFWMQNEGVYQTCHLNVNKGEAFKNLRKHIKKNMASSFSSANQYQIVPNYKKMTSYFDDHKCTSTPEQGIPTTNHIKVSQVGQAKSHGKLESEYNYMSMMIARSRHLPDIKEKLKRYGYKFYVDHPFVSYKFKHANHSAVLYHNVKFQTLLKEVCFSKDFIYEGKNILTINVTTYLKFKNRTSQNMLGAQYAQTINDWLHKEFPNEKLRFWEFIVQKNMMEYYLQTQSKLSTLFLYRMLQNYGEEVIFKCPHGLDKMSRQERAHRFRQLDILSQSKQFYNEPQPMPQISQQNRVKQTGRNTIRVSVSKPKHL